MPKTINAPDNQGIPDVYLKEQQPTYTTTDGEPVKFLEFNNETQQLYMRDPETYMPLYSVEKRKGSAIFIGPGINQWNQLKQFARNITGGPYTLDGRDGELHIHNSKASRPISARYTYAGGSGELLECRIKTKFGTAAVDASKSSDIDPDDLSLNTNIVHGIPDTGAMVQNGQIIWWNPKTTQRTLPADKTRMDKIGYSPVYKGQDPGYERIKEGTDLSNPRSFLSSYASEDLAIKTESNRYIISQTDIEAYFRQLKTNFETINKKEVKTKWDLQELVRIMNHLDPYIVKKKVWIESTVQPDIYNRKGLRVYPIGYQHPSGATMYDAELARQLRWDTGYNYLKNQPHITIITKPGSSISSRSGYSIGDPITILTHQEIEIPINGARILSSSEMSNITQVMGNDIVETLQNQIEAEATIIGNPLIESSMNVDIMGISGRYSGTYYSKKVSHKIDQSGYTCDIDFVQKIIPVSVNSISAKANTQKIYSSINRVAKESLKSESYKIPDKFDQQLRVWRKDLQSQSLSGIFIQDADNPETFKVSVAKEDFSGTYAHEALDAMKVGKVDNVGLSNIQNLDNE